MRGSPPQRDHERQIRRAAGWATLVGVAIWLVAPAWTDLGYDANAYVATAHGWLRTGELVLQWGDVLTWAPTPPGHSHHFPPGYPLYLGMFFALFGYGLVQAKLAAVVVAIAALAVVYLTTRNLYGATAGAVAAALLAVNPHALWLTSMGMSEMLAVLLFTLTMWAILRSLRDERWIVVAGAAAGLAYLVRASMGAFFVIAGGAGLLWRLYHRGWRRTLGSPWYAAAIVLFGVIVGAWAWRNVALYGWPNWETSPGVRGVPRWIWEHRPAFAAGLLARTPLMLAVGAPFLLFAWPEARKSIARVRDEHTSALWLSVALVLLLGVVFSAAYLSMGPSRYELLRLDNMRYVMVGIVPLTWALVREADWSSAWTRRRWGGLGLVLLLVCPAVLAFPAQYLPSEAARALDPHLEPGDHVAVAGAGKYPFYAYVSRPETLTVYVEGNAPDIEPEWIIALYPLAREGYIVVLEERRPHPFWLASDDHVVVLAREDVAAARNVTKLDPARPGW